MSFVYLELNIQGAPGQEKLHMRSKDLDGSVDQLDEISLHLQLDRLRELESKTDEYGLALGEMLFADHRAKNKFGELRGSAAANGKPLRVTFVLSSSHPHIERIHWEWVHDPEKKDAIAVTPGIYLARRITSVRGLFAGERDTRPLRALIAIANPQDAVHYHLAHLNRDSVAARMRDVIHPIHVTDLAQTGRVSLAGLQKAMEDEYDILLLMCHGQAGDRGARLLVEQDEPHEPEGHLISADDLLACFPSTAAPKLVFLASCHTADQPMELPFMAFAPHLAKAGVQAVIGMSGPIPIDSAIRFVEETLTWVRRTGDIDQSVSEGRRALRLTTSRDWTIPVLYSRLEDGQLGLPSSGYGNGSIAFDRWQDLRSQIEEKRCIPVLGPGLLEPWFGHATALASALVKKHSFPVQRHPRLTQVARFLSVKATKRQRMLDQWEEDQRLQLNLRHPQPPESALPLAKLVDAVYEQLRRAPGEAHAVLARLRLPVYITTDPFDILANALRAMGAKPVQEFARWHPALESIPSVLPAEYEPDEDRPLIYHIFGYHGYPESLVLSDQDVAEWLMNVRRIDSVFPLLLRDRIAQSGMLMLGFEVEEIEFQSLFGALSTWMRPSGRQAPLMHVASHREPDRTWTKHPNLAKPYFDSYFGQRETAVAWGTTAEFMSKLQFEMGRSDEIPAPVP
jgi:hypothetical protein